MSKSRNIDVLRHMIRYCNEIDEAVERSGGADEAFQTDSMFRNAVAMCILQIGELTTHLSDEFKAAYKEMPWQDIKAMRNVAAHRYGSFDWQKMKETIQEDIPALKGYCQSIVEQYDIIQQPALDEPIEEPKMTM